MKSRGQPTLTKSSGQLTQNNRDFASIDARSIGNANLHRIKRQETTSCDATALVHAATISSIDFKYLLLHWSLLKF